MSQQIEGRTMLKVPVEMLTVRALVKECGGKWIRSSFNWSVPDEHVQEIRDAISAARTAEKA